MEDTRWRCTYCGNVNQAESKACERCSVRGVIKAPVKSTSGTLFGFAVIILIVIVAIATFI